MIDARKRASIMHHGSKFIVTTEDGVSESVAAIRPKNRFWRAPMRRRRRKHENFFIAKICDSESAHAAFERSRRVALTSIAHRSSRA
jgi:hypothetical protein